MGTLDHGTKRMAASDRRAFLHIAGCLDIGEDAEVEPWERELVAAQRIADHLFVVRRGGAATLEHVESLARWHAREVDDIVERAMTMSVTPDLAHLPVSTTVLLMRPVDVPGHLPELFARVRGKLTTTLEVRFKRLWEEEAADVLALDRPAVLPLVPLARHSAAQLDEAALRARGANDEDLMAQFLTNASWVYNKDEVRRFRMLFAKQSLEIAKETWFGQEIIDIGRAEGLAKGRMDALRIMLSVRFPALADAAEIDRLPVAALDEVIAEVTRAQSEEEARTAIVRRAPVQ